MAESLSILILEDSNLDAELIMHSLQELPTPHIITHANSKRSFLEALVVKRPDIILADYNLPDFGALAALKVLSDYPPHIPLIVVSGSVGDESAVQTVTTGGAADYVLKNNLIRLVPTVMRTMEKVQSQMQLEIFREQLQMASKSEALGLMSAGIAHDFNNILAIISGSAEIMTMENIQSNSLDAIRSAAARGAGLTRQLLEFSRNEPHKLRTLDLNKIVQETHALLSSTLKGNVHFQVDLQNEQSLVYADKSQLDQVVTNFAINARDAISGNGAVQLSTSTLHFSQSYETISGLMPAGEYICLRVKDDGCGMPAEVREKMFQPFFTTKGRKGTGLGLSVVKGIVTQNKWYLQVDSKQGEGTSMYVYIPAATDRRDSREFAQNGNGLAKILFVDDDKSLSYMVQEYLTSQGYAVMTADTLSGAVEKFKMQPADLVLCDINLPDGVGPEFVKSLRANNPAIRVIYHSGYSGEKILRAAGEQGVPFLKKPWLPEELSQLIQKELGQ